MQVSFLLLPEYGRALFFNKKDFGRGKRKMRDKGGKAVQGKKKVIQRQNIFIRLEKKFIRLENYFIQLEKKCAGKTRPEPVQRI